MKMLILSAPVPEDTLEARLQAVRALSSYAQDLAGADDDYILNGLMLTDVPDGSGDIEILVARVQLKEGV